MTLLGHVPASYLFCILLHPVPLAWCLAPAPFDKVHLFLLASPCEKGLVPLRLPASFQALPLLAPFDKVQALVLLLFHAPFDKVQVPLALLFPAPFDKVQVPLALLLAAPFDKVQLALLFDFPAPFDKVQGQMKLPVGLLHAPFDKVQVPLPPLAFVASPSGLAWPLPSHQFLPSPCLFLGRPAYTFPF